MTRHVSVFGVIMLFLCLACCGCRDSADVTGAPGRVTDRLPIANASDVPVTIDLKWGPAARATSYMVYFGTDEKGVWQARPSSAESKGEQTEMHFDPAPSGNLAYATCYYWRIDTKNGMAVTRGEVWCFETEDAPTVAPGQVSNPDPEDGAVDVPVEQVLRWAAAAGANSYDVYFGADQAAVAQATTSSPELMGNQVDAHYTPPGILTDASVFFWRVDSVNTFGTTPGPVWSFTTVGGRLVADSVEGEEYSYQLTVNGTASGYTWNLSGGELPPGVTLLSSGVLSGTPLVTGEYTFTANASEAGTPTVYTTRLYRIAVKAWQRPADVTSSGADSHNSSVAVNSGGVAHAAWEEGAAGSREIYYSDDLGTIAVSPMNVSNTANDSVHPSLTVDGGDNLHLVWAEDTGSTFDVMYADNDGSGWSGATTLSTGASDSEEPAVAVDSSGNIHVVWTRSSQIQWTCHSGASWTSPQVISAAVPNCGEPAIWADSEVHVVFSGGTGTSSEIYYTSWSGSAWTTPLNISQDSVESAEPAIHGQGGTVAAAWASGPSGSRQAAYRVFSDGAWCDAGLADSTGGEAAHPAVAVLSGGRATVVWQDGTAPRSLYMSQAAENVASAPVGLSYGGADMIEASLAVGGDDRIYGTFSYDGSPDYQVGYSEFAVHVWREPEEIPATGTNPRKARIAADSSGTAHCIWQQDDGPGLRNIWYASLEPGYSWASPELVSISNTGNVDHSHMFIDADDRVHVVWGGPGTGGKSQVWYARCDSGAWLAPIEVTNDAANDSYWPDIAVDSTGQMHLVFVIYVAANADQEIYYSSSATGLAWSAPSEVSASSAVTSWGPAIDVDKDDLVHVAWTEGTDVVYRSYNGVSWSSTLNISNTASNSNAPDIVTGTDGELLAVWTDYTGSPIHPMSAWHNGNSWGASANVAFSVPDRGESPGAAQYGGVFYTGWAQKVDAATRNIWFAGFDGVSWSEPVSLSNGGENWFGGCGGGIAPDNTGTIHVVFNESTAGKLWYTRK